MSRKISLILIAVSTFFTMNVFAWTPIQFSLWDGVKNLPNSTTVNGLKLGLFSSDYWGINQKVNGMELSLLSESAGINGLLLSVINMNSKNSAGVQISVMGVAENFDGLAIAVYNEFNHASAGVQLGAVNESQYNTNSYQIGAINDAADTVKGGQFGAINAAYSFDGIQFGVLNGCFRYDSSCLQIGVLNYNENGFLPLFPFFNFTVK